jgi:hypothetical protein
LENPDTGRKPNGSIPDLSWVNDHLSIRDVAVALQLRVDGMMIHCWHPDAHKHGDRTASVGINKTTNRVKCFGCGTPTMSVVDLVADVRQSGVREAVRWIDENFSAEIGVHRLTKRQRLAAPNLPYRVGHESPLELLVKSGAWAKLSAPAQSVAVVLLSFAEPSGKDALTVKLSYVGMQRNTGLKTGHSVSKAIAQLKDIGWLSVAKPTGKDPKRGEVQVYSITPFGDRLMEHVNATSAQKRKDIRTEMNIRKAEANGHLISACSAAMKPSLSKGERRDITK